MLRKMCIIECINDLLKNKAASYIQGTDQYTISA